MMVVCDIKNYNFNNTIINIKNERLIIMKRNKENFVLIIENRNNKKYNENEGKKKNKFDEINNFVVFVIFI